MISVTKVLYVETMNAASAVTSSPVSINVGTSQAGRKTGTVERTSESSRRWIVKWEDIHDERPEDRGGPGRVCHGLVDV